jgi:hypothetical protein
MDSSYNTYDKISSLDWNGSFFVLTVRNELTDTFTHAYSPDGIKWTKDILPSNITTQNPYTNKWVGDKYFIGGNLVSTSLDLQGNPIYTNCVATVKDTSNVNIVPIPQGDVIYDIEKNLEYRNTVIFPKSTIISVGGTSLDATKIAYSLDQGVTWISSSNSSNVFTETVYDAVWNGRIWVAVGSGGNTFATSQNGDKWTGRGSSVISEQSNAVDWSDKLAMFVAVGSGTNSIATSSDGIHWLRRSNLLSSGNDVKWNGEMWVAVGVPSINNKSIVYSYDGIHWSAPEQSDLFNNSGLGVSWNGSIWTAIGEDTAGKNIATSTDGIHWTMITENALSYPLKHVYSDEEYTIICANNGTNSQIYVVSGNDFTSPTIHSNIVSNVSAVGYDGIKYLIGGLQLAESPDFTTYNDNGFSAFNSVQSIRTNNSSKGYATIQPLTIACGEGNTSLAYSEDGIQWSAINNTIFSRANNAVWNGLIWVAVGTGNYWVATSYDGIKWKGQESTLMTEGYDVAWNGTAFVAVGEGSSPIVWSVDGVKWTPVSNPPFSTRASAVEWTGLAWVAYGSGTNTTATSHSLYGDSWAPTPSQNLAISQGTSALSLGYTPSSSSNESTYLAANAFDGSFNTNITVWKSGVGLYDASGLYTGSTSTTYDTSNTATGEWLQIDLSGVAQVQYYYMVFQVSDTTSIPSSWILLGSNDGTAWSSLDTFSYNTPSYPNNDWKYPFVALPLNLYTNTTSYQYYRVVFTQSFGASQVSVADIDFFTVDASSNSLDVRQKPVVLRDVVLHPTQLLSVDGSNLNIYQLTDLSGALIRNGYIHDSFVNNVVFGSGSGVITGSSFDGMNHIVTSTSGVSYLSNESAIRELNFDTSYNSAVMSASMTTLYSSCYNTHFSIFGGTGTNVITYNTLREGVTPTWYATNANNLFTTVYGVSSNSGYGMTVSPNALYLNEGEKLCLVTPKSYNAYIEPEISVTFNFKPTE